MQRRVVKEEERGCAPRLPPHLSYSLNVAHFTIKVRFMSVRVLIICSHMDRFGLDRPLQPHRKAPFMFLTMFFAFVREHSDTHMCRTFGTTPNWHKIAKSRMRIRLVMRQLRPSSLSAAIYQRTNLWLRDGAPPSRLMSSPPTEGNGSLRSCLQLNVHPRPRYLLLSALPVGNVGRGSSSFTS